MLYITPNLSSFPSVKQHDCALESGAIHTIPSHPLPTRSPSDYLPLLHTPCPGVLDDTVYNLPCYTCFTLQPRSRKTNSIRERVYVCVIFLYYIINWNLMQINYLQYNNNMFGGCYLTDIHFQEKHPCVHVF